MRPVTHNDVLVPETTCAQLHLHLPTTTNQHEARTTFWFHKWHLFHLVNKTPSNHLTILNVSYLDYFIMFKIKHDCSCKIILFQSISTFTYLLPLPKTVSSLVITYFQPINCNYYMLTYKQQKFATANNGKLHSVHVCV